MGTSQHQQLPPDLVRGRSRFQAWRGQRKAAVGGLEGRTLLSNGLTEFPIVPLGSHDATVDSITRGPDGNIWFTDSSDGRGEVGKITPAGTATFFAVSGAPSRITPGPDGNLWFGYDYIHFNGHGIGKITPNGDVTLFPGPIANRLTGGFDGNVWFTGFASPVKGMVSDMIVGKITPKGQVTTYPIPGDPPGSSVELGDITRGRRGQLWFLASTTTTTALESVTTSGTITPHPVAPNSDPVPLTGYAVTTGPTPPGFWPRVARTARPATRSFGSTLGHLHEVPRLVGPNRFLGRSPPGQVRACRSP